MARDSAVPRKPEAKIIPIRPGIEAESKHRILPYHPEHGHEIENLLAKLVHEEQMFTLQRPQERYNEHHSFVALDEGGKLAGYATVFQHKPGDKFYLHYAVYPEHRRGRVASRLVKAAVEQALQNGVREIRSPVYEEAPQAANILLKNGFAEIPGSRPRSFILVVGSKKK